MTQETPAAPAVGSAAREGQAAAANPTSNSTNKVCACVRFALCLQLQRVQVPFFLRTMHQVLCASVSANVCGCVSP